MRNSPLDFSLDRVPKAGSTRYVKCLDAIISLISENGTLIIVVGIEKRGNGCAKDTAEHSSGSAREGLNTMRHGSADITEALEEVGMEEIAVIGDQLFFFESKYGRGLVPPEMRWKEMYFGSKARRGEMVAKKLPWRMKGFYRVIGFTKIGGERSACKMEGQGVEITRRGRRGS